MSDAPDPSLGFLEAELQSGFTFAALATDAEHDVEKRERNRQNANTAVATIERMLPKLSASLLEKDVQGITTELGRLKRVVAAIPGSS